MKIKLFYKKSKQTNQELQEEVNAFMADVDVVDVKYSEGTYGDYEGLYTDTSLLVLYNDKFKSVLSDCNESSIKNDDWELYNEKFKTPEWVNLKTGERYEYRNKENLTQFLKRLEEKDMTKTTPLHENLELKSFNFDEFIKDSCDFAEAMTLDVNKQVLPDMLDKNMSNWDQLLYMVKEGQLVYSDDSVGILQRLRQHEERLDKLEEEMALIKERLRSLEN